MNIFTPIADATRCTRCDARHWRVSYRVDDDGRAYLAYFACTGCGWKYRIRFDHEFASPLIMLGKALIMTGNVGREASSFDLNTLPPAQLID